MHPFKRGAWSEDETNELLLLVTTHGKKWSEIQTKLNRSADSCRDKYREFHMDYTKGKWQEAESTQLEMHVRAFLKVARDVPLGQLGRMAEEDAVNVPWSAISKKMKNRSRLSCFKRFQQITGMKKTNGMKRKRAPTTSSSSSTSTTAAGETALPNITPAAAHAALYKIEDLTDPEQGVDHPTMAMTTPNPIQPVQVGLKLDSLHPTSDTLDVSSYDRNLLHLLATSSHVRESDVAWKTIRHPLGNAKDRWQELLDKWIEAFGVDEDEIMDRPIWEVAKMMMENEGVEDQAEMAARTVEAVFLC